MSNRNKKLLSYIAAALCTICFIVAATVVYNSAIVKGLNIEGDQIKEAQAIRAGIKDTVEGSIIDRNGVEITTATEKGEPAKCNYDECFSYIVGYNSKRLNQSGLRKVLGAYLFDGGKDGIGASVQLTINASIQQRAYDLLKGTVGSISIVDAETGEIIALASRSNATVGYNVNKIDEIYGVDKTGERKFFYDEYYNTLDKFYYNRAIFAEDPPGSCAKIITATSLVENGFSDLTYNDDTGKGPYSTHNYKGASYGAVDLEKALHNSINTYFANAGIVLGNYRLKKTYSHFMVGETVPLDFSKTGLRSNYANQLVPGENIVAHNAYGQGELIMTPLHLAMSAAAIMNDAVMMQPYMISTVTNDGKVELKAKPHKLSEVTDKKTAKQVKGLLHSTAMHYGMYKDLPEDDVYIIAKTGTAQPHTGKGNHIYFTMGLEINDGINDGRIFGVCIDKVETSDTGSTLMPQALAVIQMLLEEYVD